MRNINWLKVSETFYSIQGEGVTTGVPAVFLRLTSCNLLCKSEDWICDTIKVWKKGVKTDFVHVLEESHIQRLKEGAHLVITGGEPLLQQGRIIGYLKWFLNEYEFKPFVEVETNGTIIPFNELMYYVNQFNCSPKLSNSGETFKRRYNEEAITVIDRHENSWFKFVISKNEDIQEMLQDWAHLFVMNKVILMPAGETQNELNKTRSLTLDLCKNLGLRYCDRLHIVAWNKKTGV